MFPYWFWGSLSLLPACPSLDPIPEPAGTGGDDDMSEDPAPGPGGASCPSLNIARSATPDDDPARLSTPAKLTGRTISWLGSDALETRTPRASVAKGRSHLANELGPIDANDALTADPRALVRGTAAGDVLLHQRYAR